jgi:hypothetical protein
VNQGFLRYRRCRGRAAGGRLPAGLVRLVARPPHEPPFASRLLGGRFVALVAIAALAGAAIAQQYRVDDSGGPLTLAEDVAAAAAAWDRASDRVDLEESASAGATFGFGSPELMGPDLVSLTLLPDDGRQLEVRLHPRLYRENRGALLHELGLLLGLPAGGTGVMDPALTAGEAPVPGSAEAAALTALRERVAGDIDGDGLVGLSDLAELGRAYGQRGVNLAADLDGDGVVAAGDVEILRREYRFVEPREAAAEEEEEEEEAASPSGE